MTVIKKAIARTLLWSSVVLVSLSYVDNLHAEVAINTVVPNDTPTLTVDDVNGIVTRAVSFLKSVNESGLVCVADREGHVLAMFRMNPRASVDVRINEQAIVKARSAAFFQSDDNAFTTRTAQFIVQSHFPPTIANLDAGPLFGVPFSSLPGSDGQLQQTMFVFINGVNAPPSSPPGSSNFRPTDQPLIITPLTDDPGGVPLFKKVNGKARAVGGVGVEIDGFGVLANGVPDAGFKKLDPAGGSKMNIEEQASLAAQQGFEPPDSKKADRILVNGFRFPYVAVRAPKKVAGFGLNLAAEGHFEPVLDSKGDVVPVTAVSQPRSTPLQEFPKQGFLTRFPPKTSAAGLLTEADVRTIVQQAADQAFITRGAIRRPIGSSAQVFISVVDLSGSICGVFRTSDATVFSFDVAIQKARTAAFFSTNQVGFSTRAIGFMSQTIYPPGIDANLPGPLSGLLPPHDGTDPSHLGDPLITPIPLDVGSGPLREISHLLTDAGDSHITTNVLGGPVTAAKLSPIVQTLSRRLPHSRDGRLSPIQVAISVDLALGRPSAGIAAPVTTIPNGITLFPGGVPLYKNGVLIGAVGVSGDGVDQDDVICFAGSKGYEPPVRCDEASSDDIVTALKSAIAKAKLHFPNLTDGQDSVLDIVSERLNHPPDEVLQNLRLPYVKFPRELKR